MHNTEIRIEDIMHCSPCMFVLAVSVVLSVIVADSRLVFLSGLGPQMSALWMQLLLFAGNIIRCLSNQEHLDWDAGSMSD